MEIVVVEPNQERKLIVKVKSTDTVEKIKRKIKEDNNIQQSFDLVLPRENVSANTQNNELCNPILLKETCTLAKYVNIHHKSTLIIWYNQHYNQELKTK